MTVCSALETNQEKIVSVSLRQIIRTNEEFQLCTVNMSLDWETTTKTVNIRVCGKYSQRLKPSHPEAAQEALEACGIAQGPA